MRRSLQEEPTSALTSVDHKRGPRVRKSLQVIDGGGCRHEGFKGAVLKLSYGTI